MEINYTSLNLNKMNKIEPMRFHTTLNLGGNREYAIILATLKKFAVRQCTTRLYEESYLQAQESEFCPFPADKPLRATAQTRQTLSMQNESSCNIYQNHPSTIRATPAKEFCTVILAAKSHPLKQSDFCRLLSRIKHLALS